MHRAAFCKPAGCHTSGMLQDATFGPFPSAVGRSRGNLLRDKAKLDVAVRDKTSPSGASPSKDCSHCGSRQLAKRLQCTDPEIAP
ncbi:hypothetical protein WJX82_003574 [Trebouxia sp. C0006]